MAPIVNFGNAFLEFVIRVLVKQAPLDLTHGQWETRTASGSHAVFPSSASDSDWPNRLEYFETRNEFANNNTKLIQKEWRQKEKATKQDEQTSRGIRCVNDIKTPNVLILASFFIKFMIIWLCHRFFCSRCHPRVPFYCLHLGTSLNNSTIRRKSVEICIELSETSSEAPDDGSNIKMTAGPLSVLLSSTNSSAVSRFRVLQ